MIVSQTYAMDRDETCSTGTDADGFDTPTHTSVCEDVYDLHVSEYIKEEPPLPGGVYIIRDPETRLVIALEGGKLRLASDINVNDRSAQWRCVRHPETWYGFQNVASGTFIGHNDHGQFIAEVRWHRSWEQFRVDHHENGGYVLLVRRDFWYSWFGPVWFEPMEIEGDGDEMRLVTNKARKGGTAWRFLRLCGL